MKSTNLCAYFLVLIGSMAMACDYNNRPDVTSDQLAGHIEEAVTEALRDRYYIIWNDDRRAMRKAIEKKLQPFFHDGQ